MNNVLFKNTTLKKLMLFCIFLFFYQITWARTYTAFANGNWNGGTAVWTCSGGGCAGNPNPTSSSNDVIIIPSSFTITLNVNFTVNQSGSLTVNGSLIQDATSRTLTIGTGSGSAGNCSSSGSTTITCGSTSTIITNFTSNGSTLNVTGTGFLRVSDMTIEKACAFVAGTMRILDDLSIINQGDLIINGTVQVVGDWTLNNGNVTASGTGFLDVGGCINSSPANSLANDVSVKYCVNQNNACTSNPSNPGTTTNPCYDCLGTQLPLLPLQLKASLRERSALINWVQPVAEALQGFELDRFTDNMTKGTTIAYFDTEDITSPKSFQYFDEQPGNGVVYYRLKWIRADMSYGYSNFVSLVASEASMKIYPNPVSNHQFTIQLPFEVKNPQITIYNLMGQLIPLEQIKKEGSTIEVQFTTQPQAGLYFVRAFNGIKYVFQKFQVN